PQFPWTAAQCSVTLWSGIKITITWPEWSWHSPRTALGQLKSQAPGSVEELRCLQMLNQQPEGSSLEELSSSQGCLKLASTIKAYVATVTENIIRRSAVKGEGKLPPKAAGKPSAHLALRPQNLAQDGSSQRFGTCHSHAATPSRTGARQLHSHVHNMTYRAGRLRVEQPGKYYVYSQIYFRYPRAVIQWQPAHSPAVLLLKGVGTKCWAPEADYGLHALYQGGLFELKAGDELFVSVSSLAIDYNDAAASYFGAFRLDL
uniref:THD domain-containing protein n=1 Tax=Malurus cyaneus samueli TaxID=2593467 RepID=A0A8C5U3F3_9PASS